MKSPWLSKKSYSLFFEHALAQAILVNFSIKIESINFSPMTGQRSARELWLGFWPLFLPLFSTHKSVILDQAREEIFKIESRTVSNFHHFQVVQKASRFPRHFLHLSLSALLQFKRRTKSKPTQNDGKRGFLARLVWSDCLLLKAWEQENRACSVVCEVPAATDHDSCHTVTGWTPHSISGWEATALSSPEDGRSSCYHPCGFKALMCTPCVWAHCRSQLSLGPQ